MPLREASSRAQNILQSLTDSNVVPTVEKLVPQIKAAVPTASPADLVNGQKRSRLNIFSQLAYTEAVAGTIAPPPAGKKASLR